VRTVRRYVLVYFTVRTSPLCFRVQLSPCFVYRSHILRFGSTSAASILPPRLDVLVFALLRRLEVTCASQTVSEWCSLLSSIIR